MTDPISRRSLLAPTLSLFASTSTLLCCALPALLVTIGAGAVMTGISSNIPGYVWLTEQKVPLFILSGLMLGLAIFFRWRSRNAPCPVDSAAAQARAMAGVLTLRSTPMAL